MDSLKEWFVRNKSKILWAGVSVPTIIILYVYYDIYESSFCKAVFGLVKVGAVFLVWKLSCELAVTSKSVDPIVYTKTIIICAALAYYGGAMYGTHTEGGDPLFGGGGEFVIDFEPSEQEKNDHAWYLFFSLVIPALIGVNKGLDERHLKVVMDSNNASKKS